MVVPQGPSAKLNSVQCQVQHRYETKTYLVIRRYNLITDTELAVFHSADMQHIAIEDLNIRDLELRNTIDDDATSVVFLSTRFCVEACAIKK